MAETWQEEAIVLAARRHGESALLVSLLTRAHGRHLGIAPGGGGRRQAGLYEPGNLVQATWRARLAEHLGSFKSELVRAPAARLLAAPTRLAALAAACALLEAALPERAPHPGLYEDMLDLLAALLHGSADHRDEECGWAQWGPVLVRWELRLLAGLGFGLGLERCAVHERCGRLTHVSPRTGRAVCAESAAPYIERLLPLPLFLAGRAPPTAPLQPQPSAGTNTGAKDDREGQEEGTDPEAVTLAALLDGLALTGFFFDRHVFAPLERALPPARERLVQRLHRLKTQPRRPSQTPPVPDLAPDS